jgi:serine/threonine protein kinase
MDQHDLEAGVQIGDFRIERRLGAGGMGIVYQARQVSLDRIVALKILGAALSREANRTRFQREAQAVAKLSHPGIAGVHFIGQDRHVCYMAMEFIDGLSLREVIDRLSIARDPALTIDLAVQEFRPDDGEAPETRFDQPTADYIAGEDTQAVEVAEKGGPNPEAKQVIASRGYLRRCCELVHEAALALAHAHERGVIHRDVKPENILIDRQGRIHLIDFGVARFFEDVSLTNTGALVGTPMYMSPEQVTGRLDHDHRTDIYSLGVVLYELLTLGQPIASPTREGVLRQIVTKAMPPASLRNAAIPRDLEGVLHKATARDPDDRYQSALEFAADLQSWLDGKPVVALPYRYRLDRREIKAERPGGIVALAFAHFMIATIAAFMCSGFIFTYIFLAREKVASNIFQGDMARGLSREEQAEVMVSGLGTTSLLMAYTLWVGFGLLAANRWARWASIAGSTALAAWMLHGAIRDALHGHAPIVEGVVLALAAWSVVYLMRRSTRDWFRLAARLRSEHSQSATAAR